MLGDSSKALLDPDRPSLGWGQPWDLTASCTRKMMAGSICALASDAQPRGARCSPSTSMMKQTGASPLPGSPAASGFMLFHNVFWEMIAGF